MPIAIIVLLWQFTCATALQHTHDDVRVSQIDIVSWSGCTVSGRMNGETVQLLADGSICPLRQKVPGIFNVRYDFTCKQIIDLSDGALPECSTTPTPEPAPAPTPTATPTPTPAPFPSPTATPTPTPSPKPSPKPCGKPWWKPWTWNKKC